jgi:ketopantoate reductase
VELESIWEEPLRRAKAIGLSMPRLEQLVEAIRAKIAERGEG